MNSLMELELPSDVVLRLEIIALKRDMALADLIAEMIMEKFESLDEKDVPPVGET